MGRFGVFGIASFLSSQLVNSLLASANCLALSQQPCKNAGFKAVYLKRA